MSVLFWDHAAILNHASVASYMYKYFLKRLKSLIIISIFPVAPCLRVLHWAALPPSNRNLPITILLDPITLFLTSNLHLFWEAYFLYNQQRLGCPKKTSQKKNICRRELRPGSIIGNRPSHDNSTALQYPPICQPQVCHQSKFQNNDTIQKKRKKINVPCDGFKDFEGTAHII